MELNKEAKISIVNKRDKLFSNNFEKNKEKVVQNYIEENSQNLLNNSLHDFIKDKNYENIKSIEFKNEILYFASFINSCKDYNDINILKKDIKYFFKNVNKNENTECHFNIIFNYLKKLLNIISTPEFYNQENNCKQLLKILKYFDKNMNLNLTKECNEYIAIQKNILQVYQTILMSFSKNNIDERVRSDILQLIKKIGSYPEDTNKSNLKIKANNHKDLLIINNGIKEKENKNLNDKMNLKDKNIKTYNNKIDNKQMLDKNPMNKQVINNNKLEKNNKFYYNYENIKFPPIVNNDDSYLI